MKKNFTHYIIIFLLLASCNCKQHPPRTITRSFYYWKSIYQISDYEKVKLNKLNVHLLYIKFFDVTWNDKAGIAAPAAKILFKDSSYKSFKITPVIFITNEVLTNTNDSSINTLAQNTGSLLIKMIRLYNINNIREIQFDCDWTASTKNKYFQLLTTMRTLLNNNGFANAKLSVTIRLYQCRYRSKTGVPAADKGMLMCYNMGNLKNINSQNSILESSELKKYISSLNHYPLPLDVALPLFDWKVLFRNNTFVGLIKELPDSILQHTTAITSKNNTYTFLKDTIIQNYVFEKGDVLRNEQSNYDEIIRSAKLVNAELRNQNFNLILYHLDSLTLSKYTTDEMENIFSSMY